MDIKKFAPWNWFKKEEEEGGSTVPVLRADAPQALPESGVLNPIVQLHREMDRLFDNAFRGFGLSPLRSDFFTPLTASGLLKPQVDIGATDKEYSITVEVPGVDEKDVRVEIANNTLTIRGEKKQEKEEKDKNYYRVERSYGSFQRVLSLPEDADQDGVKASFKKGVLTIAMPRKPLPKAEVKQIEIKSDE
ncbi:MAG: Hsp20/alpha crystallin family protein [Desulfobulbaceae bacterium]|jgi:HSP20 family protein|nr:Hsp20/alpha crystallin family protein [Desulfobulbaceae bacterium]MDY0351667.1 Hsp20/alpha crystallin family protein [Desulfobulbaceae bacterium]